jgi:hypothetical protein
MIIVSERHINPRATTVLESKESRPQPVQLKPIFRTCVVRSTRTIRMMFKNLVYGSPPLAMPAVQWTAVRIPPTTPTNVRTTRTTLRSVRRVLPRLRQCVPLPRTPPMFRAFEHQPRRTHLTPISLENKKHLSCTFLIFLFIPYCSKKEGKDITTVNDKTKENTLQPRSTKSVSITRTGESKTKVVYVGVCFR